jgi:hypothetical protein
VSAFTALESRCAAGRADSCSEELTTDRSDPIVAPTITSETRQAPGCSSAVRNTLAARFPTSPSGASWGPLPSGEGESVRPGPSWLDIVQEKRKVRPPREVAKEAGPRPLADIDARSTVWTMAPCRWFTCHLLLSRRRTLRAAWPRYFSARPDWPTQSGAPNIGPGSLGCAPDADRRSPTTCTSRESGTVTLRTRQSLAASDRIVE